MIAGTCHGQKRLPLKTKQNIDLLIDSEKYNEALNTIRQNMPLYGNEVWLKLQYGICLLNIDGQLNDAITVLQGLADAHPIHKKQNKEALASHFYLGQALRLHNQFDESHKVFETLRNNLSPKQGELISAVDREIAYNDNALELIKKPVSFQITNLGSTVNSPYDEHSPVVSADETVMVFTSTRPVDPDDTLNMKEEIYVSDFRDNHWTEATLIDSFENPKGANASVSISADGKTLLIYQFDGFSGDIYQSIMTFNGWSLPEKLPVPINSDYNETHACYSADGNTLYFSSDRPGGFGNSDIYMIRRLPDGSWGKLMNLGAVINSAGDEDSPFIQPDDKTLYFASTEHTSIGGFDIFQTTKEDSVNWSTPQNVGFPINTPDDDLFFNPSVDGIRVYFASRREGGKGLSDIYMMTFNENDARTFAVVAGFVFNQDNKPTGEINISVSDNNGDIVGVYRPNPMTGKYVMVLPAGKTFKVSYMGAQEQMDKSIEVPAHANYTSGNWAHYLDPVIIRVP
jgi:Tol biopolymer transport system component